MKQYLKLLNRILREDSSINNGKSSSKGTNSGFFGLCFSFAGLGGLHETKRKQTPIDDTNNSSGENFTDEQTKVIRKTLNFDSPYVINRIRTMGKYCHSAWQYACLLAVMDDHGIVNTRYNNTSFARLLIVLGIPKYKDAKKFANSIRYTMLKLPTKYKSWGNDLQKEKSFCISLAANLDDTTPYRYTENRA